MKDGLAVWAMVSQQQRRHSSCKKSAGADFYERSMQALVNCWRKCRGDYAEKEYFVAENSLHHTVLLRALHLLQFQWE